MGHTGVGAGARSSTLIQVQWLGPSLPSPIDRSATAPVCFITKNLFRKKTRAANGTERRDGGLPPMSLTFILEKGSQRRGQGPYIPKPSLLSPVPSNHWLWLSCSPSFWHSLGLWGGHCLVPTVWAGCVVSQGPLGDFPTGPIKTDSWLRLQTLSSPKSSSSPVPGLGEHSPGRQASGGRLNTGAS